MKSWMGNYRKKMGGRGLLLPALALGLASFLLTNEGAKVAAAGAAAPAAPVAAAAPAAALDDSSVNALLALDRATETLAARVTPAVVNVAVTSRMKTEVAEGESPEGGSGDQPDDGAQRFFGQFFGQRMRPPTPQVAHGIGSGVIVSPDGYIVTNNHVVDGATDIRVSMNDRRSFSAKLIGTDPITDLAVIKINAPNLPSIPWGDSAKLHPGQTVLAFGNPFGWFRFSVTRGIVSALNRPNPFSTDSRRPGGFIQTDAAINQGNSGGPLVNARGEVIGINTFLISPTGAFAGMGFAIPAQIARPTVETLIRDGKVTHARMGVGIEDLTPENSKFFRGNDGSGALVTQVTPDSPASKAGLHVGDVIRVLDGETIIDAGQLQVAIGERRPGVKITLQVMRDGNKMTVPLTLEEMDMRASGRKGTTPKGQDKARWGIGLQDIKPELREQLQVPENIQGAVINSVEPGSSADNAGLIRGTIILEVNRQPVHSAEDVQQALKKVAKGEDALVLLWSNGGSTFRVLHSPEGA